MLRRRHALGYGVASVLLFALIGAVLLTVLMGTSMSTLRVQRHSEGVLLARGASESALARAIYAIRRDSEFGLSAETIRFEPQDESTGGRALITFDPLVAESDSVPLSVNNLDGSESVKGPLEDVIPARTVRLYSRGRCHSETRTLILDIHIPAFPYAIATEGRFVSSGNLSLTGVSEVTGEEIPGHLASNCDSPQALTLGANSEVSGDLRTAGRVVLKGEDIEVGGEIREGMSPVSVPEIPLHTFDPSLGTGEYTTLAKDYYLNAALQGKALFRGDITFGGDTDLDGAVLFVDGDLSIDGTLSGKGALIATGSIRIQGAQRFASDHELAILSGRDLRIEGDGASSSGVQGLLYSEGDVEIRNTTVRGSLISQSRGGCTPTVTVEQAGLQHRPESTSVEVSLREENFEVTELLAFKRSGNFDAKNSTTAEKLAKGIPEAAGLGGKKNNRLYLGVTLAPDGTYRIFAPDEDAPIKASCEADALECLAEAVERCRPGKKKNKIKWRDNPKKARRLLKQLQCLLPQEPTQTEKTLVITEEVEESDFEINPTRFIAPGAAMRIRAIRILENSGAESGR